MLHGFWDIFIAEQKVEVTQNKPFPASPALLFWKPIESGGAMIGQTRMLGVLVPEPEEEQVVWGP